jgi:hypothetical protein
MALAAAEHELSALDRAQPDKAERDMGRVVRMLPRAFDLLRERVAAGTRGLRDPLSFVSARTCTGWQAHADENARSAAGGSHDDVLR